MNELKAYVDGLFRHQAKTAEMTELKEEILSNMLAKRDDLIAQGMEDEKATRLAKGSLSSVDGLLDGTQLTYIARYHTQCLQSSLLGSIVFWILSIPLLFTGYAVWCYAGMLAAVVLGICYIVQCRDQSDAVAFVSVTGSRRRGRLVWAVWALFFLVSIGVMAALTFGSDIWFGRTPGISGPYQFAMVTARFYLPALTVILPVTVSGFTRILLKNERRTTDE